jgi:ABC-type lipopolysaccharide export system ATPase subunit
MSKLELIDVTCAYNEDPVVKDISALQTHPGEDLALIGPNGDWKKYAYCGDGALAAPTGWESNSYQSGSMANLCA